MSPIRITQLFLHPVKSCAAVRVDQLEIDLHGTRDDRRWMIVGPDGKFVTQRDLPSLALLKPRQISGHWWLESPGEEPLDLSGLDYRESRSAQVWNDQVQAEDAGDEAAAWLSRSLGRDLRLVRMGERTMRRIPKKFGHPEKRIGFADIMPFLLISESSLRDLGSRLNAPMDARRFRPNFVIDGAEPYAEDQWTGLKIGNVEFAISRSCTRCTIINVDPDLGKPSEAKPLTELATYRRKDRGVHFGQYLIQKSAGLIRIGDPVEITSTG